MAERSGRAWIGLFLLRDSGIGVRAFERLTRDSNWLVIDQIKQDIKKEVGEVLTGNNGLGRTLLDKMQASHNLLSETVHGAYTETIKKEVFSAGVIGASSLWAGKSSARVSPI